MQMEQPPRKIGCMQMLGIGCAGALVLAFVVGVVLYYKAGDWLRAGGAAIANLAATEVMDEFEIPKAERDAAMVPIREFTEKVKNNEVSPEQIGQVMKTFAEGPAFAAIAARGFEAKYLKKSGLTDDEKAEGKKTLTRFAHGISSGAVSPLALDGVKDIVTTPKKGGNKDEFELKETLTDEEVRKALAHMKSHADRAEVEDREFKVDLAKEIRASIEKGMSAAP
jgi:hypothetical protein